MCPGDSPNLILAGLMGTGKTSAGREIARRLDRPFVDMDTEIEAQSGKSIRRLFAEEGEAAFRQLEAAQCHSLAARTGLVIATGGGALLLGSNRDVLSASGPVICLDADPDEIVRRLAVSADRPLLDGADRRERVVALAAERAEAFGRIPLHVDTTGLSVSEVADRVLALAGRPQPARLLVRHPGGAYPVHLGRGLLARTGALLREHGLDGRVAIVTHPSLGRLYEAPVVASLEAAGFPTVVCTLPEGERYKKLAAVETLYNRFIQARMDRDGVVLALGGGVIGDTAGFAAATYLRGVPLVQVPTTLLAMVDASVGGKVAVDHTLGKNLIGAFKQPELVVADPDMLGTLPQAEMNNGIVETIKAGIISDPLLFEHIEAHGFDPILWLIERAIRVKIAIVEEDPCERGPRMALNLGHTVGHALELLSDYRLPHGAAVGVGLVAAARLSARLGRCDPAVAVRVERLLDRFGLPTTYRRHTPADVWKAMATDKKRRGAIVRFVLPCAIGDVLVGESPGQDDVLAVLQTLYEE